MATGTIPVQSSASINPTVVYNGIVLTNNATKTQTIDASKHYILTSNFLYTTSASRCCIWSISNNTLTQLVVPSGSSYATASITGTTLTVQCTNNSQNTEFNLIQLD